MPSSESMERALALIDNDKSKVLGVAVGKHDIEPGQYVPKAAAQQAPTLRFAVPDTSKSYVVIGLDLDPPFPSFSFLGPALHWVQSGYKVTPGSTILTTNAPFVSNYIGPAPPLGGAPHRYTFFLYEEPGRFDPEAHAPPNGTTMGIWKRLRISLDDLEKRLKLGLVIAANYFTSI